MQNQLKNIKVLRATEEWQRAGAYSVRILGMNRQHHIPPARRIRRARLRRYKVHCAFG